MKTYLVIDKFTISRELLSSLVCETNNNPTLYQAKSIGESLACIDHNGQIDFLIYNPTFIQLDSNDYLKRLKQLNPTARILVISHSRNYMHVKRLIEDGADIIVSINSARNELCTAIRALVSGKSFRDNSLQSHAEAQCGKRLNNINSDDEHDGEDQCSFNLTKRQTEVLDYVTKGYANKLIAYELGVSEGTVKLHVSSILRALKVTNRTEAAMRAGRFMQSTAH